MRCWKLIARVACGAGSTPDNMMAGTLALNEPYALSRAGLCDRLMQRLLEGDGPVERLFGTNPFRGKAPPSLVRMVLIALEPAPSDPQGRYWREHAWGVHRPPTAVDTGLWTHFCDEPEVLHWDLLFFRRACMAHLGASQADGGLAPTAVEFSRPAVSYDGRTFSACVLEVTASDVEAFWEKFVGAFASPAQRSDWGSIEASARALRRQFGPKQLWRWELILSRLSAQLASRLAPVLWAPGWPRPTRLQPPSGSPAVDSWFDLLLVSHHIIAQGKACFDRAMDDPHGCVSAVRDGGIWPDALLEHGDGNGPGVTDGGGRGAWCVVSAAQQEIERHKAAGERRRTRQNPAQPSTSARELSVQSGAFLYVLLWWEVFCWHATKWRLCQRACSPWQLGTARKGAGVLELVALITHFLPAPSVAEDELEHRGERYPTLSQGDDLLWRDESGRKLGAPERL